MVLGQIPVNTPEHMNKAVEILDRSLTGKSSAQKVHTLGQSR